MIKRLARSVREYKWAAMLSPICMVGEVTMEILIPMVLAELLRQGESVTKAAEQAGFREYSTFLRSFRAMFHMSPKEFRARG